MSNTVISSIIVSSLSTEHEKMRSIIFFGSGLLSFISSSLINFDEINYVSFHQFLRQLVETPVMSPTCIIPDSAIMLTYTTYHQIDFVALQRKAMEIFDVRLCLEKRFATVCLDIKCLKLCESLGIANCFNLNVSELPSSEFREGAYNYLTYFKHEIIRQALQISQEVFFFDADCLIFNNPFALDLPHIKSKRTGKPLPQVYDMRHQLNHIRSALCGMEVNSGQIWLRNSSRIHIYLGYMMERRSDILIGKNGLLDQDCVLNASRLASVATCGLPTNLFLSMCHIIEYNREKLGDVSLQGIVSFHANCIGAGASKRFMLTQILNIVKGTRDLKVSSLP